ncbi:MerR family transcriptional regulator [Saccharothrix sp. BKS2]|uniref:MerR family transcriptional regulator n=1 Tax=Saccharothrix sp. BKS2 TaxID=3064400 RepID=UPI0039E9827F
MSDEELWTIEQLPDRVAALLADNYDGQRSGRVRELPNGRAIRWYTTIGLVDRPVAHRGRTALYGRRQLLQVVAVKKLQAAGHTIAEIQGMTVGASDARLAELAGAAGSPGSAGTNGRPGAAAEPARSAAFWRERPEAPPDVEPATATATPPAVVPALRLADGVTLVLHTADRAPDAADLAAIHAAAAPLLDLLTRTGLAPTTGEDNG